MKRKLFINALAAFGAYLVLLLATVPAATAYGWFAGYLHGLRLDGIQGTVWNGRAAEVSFEGRRLGSAAWDTHTWRLVLGHIAADIRLTDGAGNASGTASVSFGGSISLHDVDANLSLSELATLFAVPADMITGQASMHIDNLELPASGAIMAAGRIVVTGLRTSWPESMELGDYAADIDSESGALRARIHDASGPLAAQLVATVTRKGAYRVGGTLAARSGAPADLKDALQMLGGVDSAGRHTVKLAGSLSTLRF